MLGNVSVIRIECYIIFKDSAKIKKLWENFEAKKVCFMELLKN